MCFPGRFRDPLEGAVGRQCPLVDECHTASLMPLMPRILGKLHHRHVWPQMPLPQHSLITSFVFFLTCVLKEGKKQDLRWSMKQNHGRFWVDGVFSEQLIAVSADSSAFDVRSC